MVAMALGIPQPSTRWGGVDPLAQEAPSDPANWPGSVAANWYYVDGDTGDDANGNGCPDNPRKTLPSSSSGTPFPSGTVIEVHGTLTPTGQHEMFFAGTNTNPVWLRGDGAGNEPIIGKELMVKGEYVNIEHIDLGVGSGGMQMRVHDSSTLHHVMVRRCKGVGSGVNVGSHSVLGVYGSSAFTFHDFVFYDNDFSYFGDWDLGAENDYHGFHPERYVDYVWIMNNKCHHMGGDAAQIGQAQVETAGYSNTIFLGNNDFHHNGENALDIKKAKNVLSSQNDYHDQDVESPIGGVVCVVHDGPDNVWFVNDNIYNGGSGIRASDQTNLRIIGPNIHSMKRPVAESPNPSATGDGSEFGYCIDLWGSADGTVISNATLHDYQRGVSIASGATNTDIFNTIFSNREEVVEWDVCADSDTVSTTTLENCIFNSSEGFHVRWGGTTYTSLTGFTDAVDCMEDDPLLITTPGATFLTTQSGSPCIDAGKSIATLQAEFNTSFGTTLDADIFGNARVQGSAVDLGAYESTPGGDTATPTVVNQSTTVSEGATNTTLTLSDLQSTDTDTDDTTLIYTVGNVSNGSLTINGSAWGATTNDSFTQQNVIDGNILYSHDGSNTTSDSFSYSVEDPTGNTLAGQTFSITITPVDDDTPVVVNQSITVDEGATNAVLTLSELQSSDTDTDDTTLIYTVGGVTNGSLTINSSAWAYSTNDTFTQQDIIDGKVVYSHDGSNTTSDSFSYSVEDPTGNQLSGQTFSITVTPVDDDTATVVNQILTVSKGTTNTVLTLGDLQSADTDSDDTTLIYTVGNVSNGSLTIDGSGWAFTTNDTFTQQDIIDGNILYSHDDSETTSDSFNFTVEDPTGNLLSGQTFSISITPVDGSTATVVKSPLRPITRLLVKNLIK